MIVPLMTVVGVAAVAPDDDVAAMRDQQPLDLGTTWVYEVRDHGEDSGTRTSQVTGSARLLSFETGGLDPTVEQNRVYTDYPGTGPRSFTAYVAVEGNTVYQYAQEESGTWYGIVPKIRAYRLPGEEGDAWDYEGEVGTLEYSSRTELTEIVDVEVGGTTFTGCAHFVNTIDAVFEDDPDAVDVIEEWTCPRVGTVRIHQTAAYDGTDFTEELVEFHGVESNWYAEGHAPGPADLPDPAPGSHAGFDRARTFAVPDGVLGRELAWTDLRPERALVAPASDGEVMAVAEPDGQVSVRTIDTGAMLWKVQLRGPVLAAPVVVGDVVLVSDSRKQLWALARDTGLARWSYTLPDVVSTGPLVVDDRVAVPSEDGTLSVLDVADGSVAWEVTLGGAARTAPAYDGEHLLVGDSSGTLSAFDPETGDTAWSVSLDEGLAQGPVVADGRVMVQDVAGVVHAYELDGTADWQSRSRGDGTSAMTAGNGVVLTSENFAFISAFDTSDGERLWTRERPSPRSASVVVGDEVVLVTRRGVVEVYDLATGRTVESWPLPLPADDAEWFVDVAPALIGDSVVFSAFGGGTLTDTALFAYPVRPGVSAGPELHVSARVVPGTPVEPPLLAGEDAVVATTDGLFRVAPDGTATELIDSGDAIQTMGTVTGDLVVAPHGDAVQARRLSDGELVWESPSGEPVYGNAPAASADTVFYVIPDEGLVAVDLESGEPQWVQPIPDMRLSVSPLALPNGDVATGSGGLARYDGRTGDVLWRDSSALLGSAPAYAGGVLYATATDPLSNTARMAAYEAGSGAVLWSQPITAAQPFLAPAVGDGVVVGYDERTARAYDAATGDELWSVALNHDPGGSPYVSQGRVFLAEEGNGYDVDDQVYRISIHDLRTGRFLGAWEPDAMPLPITPDVGGAADGRLFVPTSLNLSLLEAR